MNKSKKITILMILILISAGLLAGMTFFIVRTIRYGTASHEPSSEQGLTELVTEDNSEEDPGDQEDGYIDEVSRDEEAFFKKGRYSMEYIPIQPYITESTVRLPAGIYMTEDEMKAAATEAANNGEEEFVLDNTITLTPLDDAADPVIPGTENSEIFSQINSDYMILIDADSGEVIAERSGDARIYPASMTKVLTVLTACQYIDDLDDTFTITEDIFKYWDSNGCSAVGLQAGDTVTVREMIYGTLVCSGADCALGLSDYVTGGDRDQFVMLMNLEAAKLGISETSHFSNCVGMHDEENYSTCKDISVILAAAMENELIRDALGTRRYRCATQTDAEYMELFNDPEHQDGVFTDEDGNETYVGIHIKNSFLTRVDNFDVNGSIEGAKTGYTGDSRCCATSYLTTPSGRHYICTTGFGMYAKRVVWDHVAVYRAYTK